MTATAAPTTSRARPPERLARLRGVDPRVILGLETALAAALMSYALGRHSLWFDETVTADLATRSWRLMPRIAVLNEPMTGFYLTIVHVWSLLAGHSEVALRSLSVVAGVVVVPVVYVLVARLFDERVALIASLLTALNTTVVAVARQARPYSIVLLLVCLATLCLVRAVDSGTLRSWLVYAAVAALAVYAHVLAVFVVAAHLASLALLPRGTIDRRRVLFAAATTLVLVLPFWGALARHGSKGLRWIGPPTATSVRQTFEAFAGGTWYLLVGCVAASAVGLFAASRSWKRSRDRFAAWRYVLLVAWLLVPVAGALVVSVARPVFVSRYLIGALPALVILTAVGVGAMRPRWFSRCFLAALIVANVAVLANWFDADVPAAYTTVPREDWRGAVAYVLARSHPGDALVIQQAHLATAWQYYVQRDGTPANAPLPVSDGAWATPLTERELRSIAPEHRHVWLIMGHVNGTDRAATRARFAERYDLVSTRQFVGKIGVLRYDARG